MKNKDLEFQTLLNEYNIVNKRIDDILARQDTMLQVSMAILGGSIAWTVTNKIADELLLGIPIIVLILFSNVFYHYTRVIASQGYREFLQNKLNEYTNGNELKASEIAKEFLMASNPISKFNSIIFPSILFVSIIYSVIASHFNLFNVMGNLLILTVSITLTIAFLKFTKGLNEKVRKFCEANA